MIFSLYINCRKFSKTGSFEKKVENLLKNGGFPLRKELLKQKQAAAQSQKIVRQPVLFYESGLLRLRLAMTELFLGSQLSI